MNDFDNDDLYQLTDSEGRRNMQGLVTALLYLVLAAVVDAPAWRRRLRRTSGRSVAIKRGE